jgi:hypothetical protein
VYGRLAGTFLSPEVGDSLCSLFEFNITTIRVEYMFLNIIKETFKSKVI